jgi:hypothetical protein
MRSRTAWALLIAANALCYCVLGFYQTTTAAVPKGNPPPFANAVQQRMEMIGHLKEIKELLKEQNALLRSGNLKVVVTLPEKR